MSETAAVITRAAPELLITDVEFDDSVFGVALDRVKLPVIWTPFVTVWASWSSPTAGLVSQAELSAQTSGVPLMSAFKTRIALAGKAANGPRAAAAIDAFRTFDMPIPPEP